MQTLKTLLTTFALLVFVALLIASWYVIVVIAVVAILYLGTSSYYKIKDASWSS